MFKDKMVDQNKMMKAVLFRAPSQLVFEMVPKPKIGSDQVLVAVSSVGFCGSDHSIVKKELLPDGTILGHEFSGTVVEIGGSAKGTAIGERVIIRPTGCGECPACLSSRSNLCRVNRRTVGVGDLPGGFAEYVVAYAPMLIPIPEKLDSQNAALAEVFSSAYHAILISKSEKGSALVLGGGPIGLALVRLLKIMGFGPIVLSEPMANKRELGIAYGADLALDPLKKETDFFGHPINENQGFQTVFECSGVKQNIQTAIDAVALSGTLCVVSMMFEPVTFVPSTLCFKEIRMIGSIANSQEENRQILNWMDEGRIDARPMVSDTVDLEGLPGAYREVIATGRAIKVMVKIGEEF